MNINYSLVSPDTTNLSEKGSLQVSEYVNFVRSKFDDIKKGELAKQEVARYYLDQELTEGADKLISGINDALGISKGYLSKIKAASKFVAEFGNDIQAKKLKAYVQEHPVSTQYEMRKLSYEDIAAKMSTGNRFTQRELESFRGNSGTTKDTIPNPAPMPVVSMIDAQRERVQELINDPSKEWINSHGSAQCYLASKSDLIRAAIQIVQEMDVMSGTMDSALLQLSKDCTSAVSRSRLRKEQAEKQTKLS